MATVRKFIINRNNIKYIYAEENFIEEDVFEYHVFDENGLRILNMDYFNSLYSTDKKITLESFLSHVLVDMQTTFIDDENIPYIYGNVCKILSKIKGKSIENPSLWGYSHALSDVINKYNNFLQKKINSSKQFFDEINYEDEYQRIKQEL